MLNQAGVQSLRLLLADPRMDPDEMDWATVREVAASAGVIVRLADALAARGDVLPPAFAARAAGACARTQRALEITEGVGTRCTELGIAHAVLRTAERYPDSGTITLLIATPNRPSIDQEILRDLPATPHPRGAAARRAQRHISAVSCFQTASGVPLRIRHGRLGRFGEHARYARVLIDRAAPRTVGQATVRAPTPEDHFTLLAIERTYMRPAFRLDDLAWAIPALRAATFNWDYLFATAISIGMLESVGAFLAYVNDVYRQLLASSIVSSAVLARFVGQPTAPTPGAERFPVPSRLARSYVHQLGATLESGRWQSAARLSLLPLVAALGAWRSA
jgi:hypothetical protein